MNNKKIPILILFALIISIIGISNVYAVNFPVTATNPSDTGSTYASTGYWEGANITINESNMFIKSVYRNSNINANFTMVVNSSGKVICLFPVNSDTQCVLPYIGYYYVLLGVNRTGTYTGTNTASTATLPYVDSSGVMNWTRTCNNFLDNAGYNLGDSMGVGPQACESGASKYIRAIRNITFDNLQEKILTINAVNIVNHTLETSFCINATGTNTTQHICTTNNSILINTVGTYNITVFNVSNNTYFNSTYSNYDFTTTNSLNISVYQSLLNISVNRLFLNNTITGFNATNNFVNNSTTTEYLLIYSKNGSNNIKIDVAGNYTLNGTCTGGILITNNCNIYGVYDSVLNVSPRLLFGNGSILTGSNITIYRNNTIIYNNFSNNTYTPVLRGEYYNFSILPINYTIQNANVTILYNITNAYTYHYLQNSFIINFYNETSNTILSGQNITLFLISSYNSSNYSTTTGGLNVTLLTPTEYDLRYYLNNESTIPRDYFVTLLPYSYENISLYIIDGGISQYYLPIIIDDKGNPVGNATVKLLRYFPSTNSYITVEMSRTDTNGQAVLRVVPNYIYYKLYVEKDNKVLVTEPAKITSSSNTYTINLLSSPLDSYTTVQNIYKNISYNTNTDTFIMVWSDDTNDVISGCLNVYEYNAGIKTVISSACSNGATGSLIKTITPNNQSSYEANGYLALNSRYSQISVGGITIDFTNKYRVTGLIGIFIAIIIVLGFALIGGESGTRGTIVSGVLAVFLVGAYGLIAYSFESMIGLVIIAVIMLYKLRGS